jgi:hypothetical protein
MSSDAHNVYCLELHAALPRLLSLFDVDPLSPTLGLGDRRYWAWKLIDFPNATFQGAVNGLARMVVHDLLPPEMAEASIVERIGLILDGLAAVMAPDGSVCEAYPREASYCTTALVLFDALVALDLLRDRLPAAERSARLQSLVPAARFLEAHNEAHGLIVNHLATAAAALFRFARETGQSDKAGREILQRILAAQSEEGWFPEYGGADPGYQTLCLYYLADLHRLHPELELAEPLRRALRFLAYAAHPDGSFGGLYGWRATRFCVPAGFEALAPEMPEARALARFARRSLAERRVVPLAAFDEPNLPVMFNAWAWAAAMAAELDEPEAPLPCAAAAAMRRAFPEAGLVVDAGPAHYTVVSWRRGGVVVHFREGRAVLVDGGAVLRGPSGRMATTQAAADGAALERGGDELVIRAPFIERQASPPTPLQFALLRLLAATVLRFRALNELLKRLLVGRLILGHRLPGVVNRRRITLGSELTIEDRVDGAPSGWTSIPSSAFNAVHMASQGYWQAQDDRR